jgi:hypothetical protein
LEVLGSWEPVQVPEIYMTITDPVETHAFSPGGGSSWAAKITPVSEVTWLIFGILEAMNMDVKIPLIWSHASGGYSINSHPQGW